MPLARIEIEQAGANRWVAEVEAGGMPGGPPFRRYSLTAQTFPGIVEAVAEAYFERVPSERPVPTPQPAAAPQTPSPRRQRMASE